MRGPWTPGNFQGVRSPRARPPRASRRCRPGVGAVRRSPAPGWASTTSASPSRCGPGSTGGSSPRADPPVDRRGPPRPGLLRGGRGHRGAGALPPLRGGLRVDGGVPGGRCSAGRRCGRGCTRPAGALVIGLLYGALGVAGDGLHRPAAESGAGDVGERPVVLDAARAAPLPGGVAHRLGAPGAWRRPHARQRRGDALRRGFEAAVRSDSATRGRAKKKVAPWSGAETAQTRPPWRCTMRRTWASPMPVPSNSCAPWRRWKTPKSL